jgi:hypothetical protein
MEMKDVYSKIAHYMPENILAENKPDDQVMKIRKRAAAIYAGMTVLSGGFFVAHQIENGNQTNVPTAVGGIMAGFLGGRTARNYKEYKALAQRS